MPTWTDIRLEIEAEEKQSGEPLRPGSGQEFAPYRSRIVWGPVLPQDRSRLVEDESRLVAAGIHSRRTAAGLLDVSDPEGEWERWRAEELAAGGGR